MKIRSLVLIGFAGCAAVPQPPTAEELAREYASHAARPRVAISSTCSPGPSTPSGAACVEIVQVEY